MFALSESVKDAQSLVWRAEEFGCKFEYPIKMHGDNQACVSFQQSTTPCSKLKGVHNCRGEWVQELKKLGKLMAVKIDTKLNCADLSTKCHQPAALARLLKLLHCGVEPVLQFRGC